MFVVGAGLSTLETAADPFLSICGPPRYSEIRLNLAQAVQGVGSFVAPLLASRVFFAHTVNTAEGLKNVQWVYLGVACFVGLLLILFFLAPMPEITDADMGTMEVEIADEYDPGPFRKQYNLFLAVSSQFCYVGAQVAVANYFINFCQEANKSSSQASDLLAVGQGLYAFNRFVAALLMMLPVFKPRYMLATYLGLCFVFVVAAITTEGDTSIAMLILVLCFESCCFATIFTLGLRGLGRHTKRGGSWLVAAISGGMVFPPMTGAGLRSTSFANRFVEIKSLTRCSGHASQRTHRHGYPDDGLHPRMGLSDIRQFLQQRHRRCAAENRPQRCARAYGEGSGTREGK